MVCRLTKLISEIWQDLIDYLLAFLTGQVLNPKIEYRPHHPIIPVNNGIRPSHAQADSGPQKYSDIIKPPRIIRMIRSNHDSFAFIPLLLVGLVLQECQSHFQYSSFCIVVCDNITKTKSVVHVGKF